MHAQRRSVAVVLHEMQAQTEPDNRPNVAR
jgi:hypothetical protein